MSTTLSNVFSNANTFITQSNLPEAGDDGAYYYDAAQNVYIAAGISIYGAPAAPGAYFDIGNLYVGQNSSFEDGFNIPATINNVYLSPGSIA
jgi:hypothetical protein